MEEALREREKQLAESQRIAHIGSWEHNLTTGQLFWSDELFRLLGLDPKRDQADFERFFGMVHPDDQPALKKAIDETVRFHKPFGIDYRFILTNGTIRILHAHAELIHRDTGTQMILSRTAQDVTERKRMEEALLSSEQNLQRIMDGSPAVIFVKDIYGKYLFINTLYEKLFHVTKNDIVGKTDYDIFPPSAADAFHDADLKALEAGMPIEAEEMVPQDDGLHHYISLKFPLFDSHKNPYAVCGIATDITERRQAEEKIRHLAFHDSLTKLPNRLLFDRLKLALSHAHRKKEMLAILFLDLDRFKVINDTLGHSVGDELLQVIANRLRICLREDDSIARVSGDEFTVLLPSITHGEDVCTIVNKILEVIKQPWVTGGHELCVTTSIGISLYPNDGEEADTLLRNADLAMYYGKEHGRNSYHFYNPTMHIKSFERMAMEGDLRCALERKEFLVYYQPLVGISTRGINSMEALVRWQHLSKGY